MLPKVPTTSNLNLVSSDFSDSAEVRDVQDGIQMAELVESLDTRELDIGDGEDLDYDGNLLGVICSVFDLMLETRETACSVDVANSPYVHEHHANR